MKQSRPGAPQWSLPEALRHWGGSTPNRVYVTDADTGASLTYAETWQRSQRWAFALRDLGVAPGICVATLMNWNIEALPLWAGLSLLKAVDVGINPDSRGRLLGQSISVTGCHTVVTAAHGLQNIATSLEYLTDLSCVIVLDQTPIPSSLREAGVRILRATELLDRPAADDSWAMPQIHEIARVVMTSGTTGPSKAVLVPWGQVIQGALAGSFETYSPQDVFYITTTASHLGGRMYAHMAALLGAGVVTKSRFRTGEFWSDIDRFGCTATSLIAAMTDFLLRSSEGPADRSHPLKYVDMVPVHPEYAHFCRRFDVKVRTGYGMSEAIRILGTDWKIEDHRSSGRVPEGWPGIEVRLVDEHDHPVAEGSVGELIVRHREPWALNQGYLGAPLETLLAWRNGWFHSGDLFRRSEDGLYYFVDRAKDAIRRRGENISSQEVEAELNAHPVVKESAVVGIEVANEGEEIRAFVVPVEGAAIDLGELVIFLQERLPAFMVPRFLEQIETLPRNSSQRTQKSVLRATPTTKTWDRMSPTKTATSSGRSRPNTSAQDRSLDHA